MLHVRVHNEFVSKMRLAGHKAEYIDPTIESLHDSVRDSEDIDIKSIEKSTNDYLAQVRAKHG